MHPQSIVHALVRLHDGALLAHLGLPDMRVPIAYALAYPRRAPRRRRARLDLSRAFALDVRAAPTPRRSAAWRWRAPPAWPAVSRRAR